MCALYENTHMWKYGTTENIHIIANSPPPHVTFCYNSYDAPISAPHTFYTPICIPKFCLQKQHVFTGRKKKALVSGGETFPQGREDKVFLGMKTNFPPPTQKSKQNCLRFSEMQPVGEKPFLSHIFFTTMVGGEPGQLVQKFVPFCLQVKLVGKFFCVNFFENNFFFKRFWKILRNGNYYTCLYDSRPRIIFFCNTLEKIYCRLFHLNQNLDQNLGQHFTLNFSKEFKW